MTERVVQGRVRRYPGPDAFTGTPERDPLAQFYTCVAESWVASGGRVYIDVKKVYISRHDADILLRNLAQYCMDAEGREAGERRCVELWRHLGPRVMRELLDGHAFIERGLFYIRPDNDVTPSHSH